MNLRELANRTKSIDVDQEIITAIKEHETDIVDANTEQLMHGFDSENQRLEHYQSSDYAKYKSLLNSAPGLGNPDLHLTGAFHSGFYLPEITKEGFRIDSKDSKRNKLVQMYDINIFGLNAKNKSEIGYSMIIMILKNWKNKLFG
jgi:hypothetical protein